MASSSALQDRFAAARLPELALPRSAPPPLVGLLRLVALPAEGEGEGAGFPPWLRARAFAFD